MGSRFRRKLLNLAAGIMPSELLVIPPAALLVYLLALIARFGPVDQLVSGARAIVSP